MSIYTKTGDKGQTSIFGGKRVSKADAQVEAYGAVDEATCFIGLAHEALDDAPTKKFITDIQLNLYKIMAYLSGAPLKGKELEDHIAVFEKEIDSITSALPKLTRFILPQGSEATARLHTARAMIRSAERRVVAYISTKEKQTEEDLISVQYLNRLSDLFFMLARKFSHDEKVT